MGNSKSNLKEEIKKSVREFTDMKSANKLGHIDGRKIFAEPLVGFVRGADPLFSKFKNIIGDFHLTPYQWLKKYMREKGDLENSPANGITVISWILPISEETRNSNAQKDNLPSKAWAHTRHYGEIFNRKLRKHIISLLCNMGYNSLSPVLKEDFTRTFNMNSGIASNWSERHIAYAAGLGTFGLSGGLITFKGKAIRCGSVIARVKINVEERKYNYHHQYCLHFKGEKCGKCINRCPALAITNKGLDKQRCSSYQKKNIDPQVYEVDVAGCGLCQTDVPCEKRIP